MVKRDQAAAMAYSQGPLGWVLFAAWVGAVVYFLPLNPGFWGFFVALFKAAVWPGYVLYHVLGLLSA